MEIFIMLLVLALFFDRNLEVKESEEIKKCGICNKDAELYICERCEIQYCDDCSASYNQFTQIDYNCCKRCEEDMVNYESNY